MIRKIKSLALTLGLLSALSASVGTNAMAAEFHATTPSTAAVFGQQITQLQLSTNVGIIKCNQALFEGLVTGGGAQQTTAQSLLLTPTITGCNVAGIGATVDTNGCKLTVTGAGQPAQTTQVDIVGCTSGKVITLTSATCTLTLPEQSNLSHAVGTNNSGVNPEDLEVNITLTGVVYQVHGTCPNFAGDTTQQLANGQLTGQATFQARKHEGFSQSTHNGHQYSKLNQTGALVGLLGT